MKKRRTKPRNAFFLEGIPPDVKTSFKAACARKKVSMKEAIVAFMRNYSRLAFGSDR